MSVSALLAILAAIYFYLQGFEKPTYTNKELAGVEIREYQGENLSSINAFRENSIKGPQYIDREDYRLKVKGLTGGEKEYTYNEIVDDLQSYEKVVRLDCVEGWSATILWEGVLLKELINRDDIPAEASTVIFHAHDGYSTSFPTEYIMDNDILMAYKMNGLELPPERGFPFQLVAESKWGYKWIKWITEIEFSENDEYKGFWESRGYSNSADLDKGFFE
ncbi:molybdopterin-dependent oxidoreductase [Candidatus Falkowbacteria bacterium]|nr:molybdopterin-dependent oxidoreductase [Candidatus Falkowbacteria bacterium]